MQKSHRQDLKERIEQDHLRIKLEWLLDHFKLYLGEFDDTDIDSMMEKYENEYQNRYWAMFYYDGNYGYSIWLEPKIKNNKIPITFYAKNGDDECGIKTVNYDDFIICVNLNMALISSPLFRTDDSMDYWYRSALVDLEQTTVLEVEE